MAKGYRFVDDLTSDVMFEAWGKDLKELFENSAMAMFEVICQLKRIEPKEKREVEVRGKDEKDLLLNWLQELIAMVDIEAMFFSRFEIREISPTRLRATVRGEEISPEKGKTVVKALTYHKFSLEKKAGKWKASVTLDI
jgi:SHS2 domain-containing protein